METRIQTVDSVALNTNLTAGKRTHLIQQSTPVSGGAVFEADSVLLHFTTGSRQNFKNQSGPVLGQLFEK